MNIFLCLNYLGSRVDCGGGVGTGKSFRESEWFKAVWALYWVIRCRSLGRVEKCFILGFNNYSECVV